MKDKCITIIQKQIIMKLLFDDEVLASFKTSFDANLKGLCWWNGFGLFGEMVLVEWFADSWTCVKFQNLLNHLFYEDSQCLCFSKFTRSLVAS